jgi:small GTP-binding protein
VAYRIALVGNPNTGKTTLFNRLSGARAKTSNFPGTTTAARIGHATLANGGAPVEAEIVDLPGLYRLGLSTPESTICREVLAGQGLYHKPDAVVVVVDACNLTRNLVLVGELLAYDEPVVVALNMVDLAQRRGLTLNAAALAREIGCPVIPIVARRGEAIDRLTSVVADVLKRGEGHTPIGLESDEALEAWADKAVAASVSGIGSGGDTLTERLDEAFTHPILGVLVFAGVMGGMFWTLFALAQLPMDLIEAVFAQLGAWVNTTLPAGAIRDLVADGVIGGIAGTAVFLPQICLLFFLISLLEDTGYLARAAFVMDRLLCRFGLPGHAFVPLLSSHACALPGIMAARLIPDRRDRLATILVAPLISCSARLPVYVFLTSMLFVGQPLYAAVAFADLGARPGLRVPEDRRHDHHGHQRRDVVAQRLPEGRSRAGGGRAGATRGGDRGHDRGARSPGRSRRSAGPRPAAGQLRRAPRPLRPAGLRAARLRLAAHGRRPHQLPRPRSVRLHDVGAAGRQRRSRPGRHRRHRPHPAGPARRRDAAVHAGHVGERARLLRAGDAVHLHARRHAAGDRLDPLGRRPARLHVRARLRRGAGHLPGPARGRRKLATRAKLGSATPV